jgi:hypothetical protein
MRYNSSMRDAGERVNGRTRIDRATSFGVVVVIGLTLVAAACSSPPTAAAFNSQANSICQSYRAKLKSVDAAIALSDTGGAGRLESALSTALAQAEQGVGQLEGLAQPTGEGTALKKAFSSENDQIQKLKHLASAIKQRNGERIQSSETAVEETEAPLNQQFDALGLTDCGSGPAPVPPTPK